MKKLFRGELVIVLLIAFVSTLVYAGAKRIDDFRGQTAIEIDGNDSTGFLSISKILITIPSHNKQYDDVIGSVIMPELDDLGDSVDNEGNLDTAIIRYYFGADHYRYLAEVDTVTLPGTTFVHIRRDLWADPTSHNDSSSVIPDLTGDNQSLMLTHFWFDYYVQDSAGTQGSLTGTMQHFFRFTEDGEE